MNFRALWPEETSEINRLIKDGRLAKPKGLVWNNVRVAYYLNGNFTQCILRTGTTIRVGVAKAMPTDKYNPAVGQSIALIRALRAPAIKLPKAA